MAQLRIFGAVGKATTRIMVDAVLAAAEAVLTAPVVVVLSPDADATGLGWHDARTRLDEKTMAVLSADSGLTAGDASPASAVTFGLTDTAQVRATDLDATLDGTTFTLITDGRQDRVRLRVIGEHQVVNALAAIAVGISCGVPIGTAIRALQGLSTLGRGRMHRIEAPGDVTVIDDTVSATAQSTAAALKALAQVCGRRRSVAVLGALSVAEVPAGAHGDDAAAVHDRIGRLIVRLNVKKLVVVGHDARHIHNAAGLEGSWDGESVLVDTPQQAYDFLREELREQDVVLVKSSPGAGLDTLADRLAGAVR